MVFFQIPSYYVSLVENESDKGVREIFETKMFIRKIKDSRLVASKIPLHKLTLLANSRK